MEHREAYLLVMSGLDGGDVQVLGYDTYDKMLKEFDDMYAFLVAGDHKVENYIRLPEHDILTYTYDDNEQVVGRSVTLY